MVPRALPLRSRSGTTAPALCDRAGPGGDFIPGVDLYDVATVVELHPESDGVRMVLIFDAMHNDVWTNRAVMGWEMELGKLEALVSSRAVGDKA